MLHPPEAADGLDDAELARIMRATRRVAVVGASNRPERPAFGAAWSLLDRGCDVVPVNPVLAEQALHGLAVAASLAEAAPLDMVDVFRAAPYGAAPYGAPVVDEATAPSARTVWMQPGVVEQAAAAPARAAGLAVVRAGGGDGPVSGDRVAPPPAVRPSLRRRALTAAPRAPTLPPSRSDPTP